MASVTLLSFSASCIFLAMLTLADQGSSSAPNFNPVSSRKANIIDCRAAFLTVGDCYLETVRAFRTGQVRILLGPHCCRAVKELNLGCWPSVFGFNPFIPPFLQSYCSAFVDPPIALSGTHLAAETLETGHNQAAESESNDFKASP